MPPADLRPASFLLARQKIHHRANHNATESQRQGIVNRLFQRPARSGIPTRFELQFEELESSATADEIAAEMAVAKTTTVAAFTRKRPARKPFPEHLPRERVIGFARVDLQLIAMIDEAREELAAQGHPVQSSILMAGFSAAGSFTNRFTMLHAGRVLAAAVGSPGGWPIAPVATDQGKTLRYPIGIDDVKKLTGQPVDLAALRRVRFLFFLGDADTNDSVPVPDTFSTEDMELIYQLFGETPFVRWYPAQRLYNRAGVRATFNIYHGASHKVTAAMWNDILNTFRTALGAR